MAKSAKKVQSKELINPLSSPPSAYVINQRVCSTIKDNPQMAYDLLLPFWRFKLASGKLEKEFKKTKKNLETAYKDLKRAQKNLKKSCDKIVEKYK